MIAVSVVVLGFLLMGLQQWREERRKLLKEYGELLGTTNKVYPHQRPCRYTPHAEHRVVFKA